MVKLYADDIPIDGIHYDDMIVQSSLPPNAIIYQSSVSSTYCPPWDSFQLHCTNCKNCGAPLPKNGRCAYCDTENGVIVKEEEKRLRSSTGTLRHSMSITPEGISIACERIVTHDGKEKLYITDMRP